MTGVSIGETFLNIIVKVNNQYYGVYKGHGLSRTDVGNKGLFNLTAFSFLIQEGNSRLRPGWKTLPPGMCYNVKNLKEPA